MVDKRSESRAEKSGDESTINYPWIITERTSGTAADRIRRPDVDCSFTITREIVIDAGFKRSPGVEVDDDG